MKISTFKRKKKFIVISLIVLIMNLFSVNVMAETLPGADTKVNLNLTGVSLRDAFRALAEVAEMNIITDNSVQGNVTINLQDITFLEAVELLAKTNGLSYRIVGNTVLVAPPSRLKAGFSEKVTRVFKLMNSEPAEVKESLNLLVKDSAIRVDDRTNSLVITAYKSQIPQIERVIDTLDQSKKQVVLQARIEEISRDELKGLGFDWNYEDSNTVAEFLTRSVIGGGSSTVNTSNSDYTAILEMLESNNKADLLANPQIATIDGKTASINIGDQVPIATTEEDEDGNKDTTVEFKDIGINLEITPRVTNNNKIVVKVKPEVSTVTEYYEAADGNEYPIISTRTAETNIRIQDGKTFAIGGLIKDEEIKKMAKVPLISELPILGKLFQNESTEMAKRELIIFITPKIISDGEEVIAERESGVKSKENTQNKSDAEFTPYKVHKDKSGNKDILEDVKIVPFEYKVKGTDTFWSISKQFKISFAAIMEHNGIKYMRPLSAGEVLTIPVPANNYYKVKEGDTVKDIAEEYNIFTQPIRQINSIKSLDGKAGMKLVLPVEVKEEDRCDFNEENKVDEVKASKDTEIESKDKNKKNKGEKSNNEEVKKQDEAESSTTKHSSS